MYSRNALHLQQLLLQFESTPNPIHVKDHQYIDSCHYPNCTKKSRQYALMCIDHAKQLYKLRIAPSTIPDAGFGLFALDEFGQDDFIDVYNGNILTQHGFNSLTNKDYIVEATDIDNKKIYIDAISTQSCISRYINENTDIEKNNVIFKNMQMEDGSKVVALFAKRHIAKGEELFVYYGPNYFVRTQ
jgi:hypothetical protein